MLEAVGITKIIRTCPFSTPVRLRLLHDIKINIFYLSFLPHDTHRVWYHRIFIKKNTQHEAFEIERERGFEIYT